MSMSSPSTDDSENRGSNSSKTSNSVTVDTNSRSATLVNDEGTR